MPKPEFDCENCLEAGWFGAVGECFEEIERCECPAGFSGRDHWIEYEDTCFVNERFKFALEVTVLVLAIASALLAISSNLYLTWIWYYSKGITPESLDARAASDVDIKRNYRMQSTLRLFLLYAVLDVFVIINHLFIIVQGRNREDGSLVLDLTHFGSAALGSVVAPFATLCVCYMSLPNIERFGKMMEINIILVKYPHIVTTAFLYAVVIICPLQFLVVVLIPAINRDLQYTADAAFLVFNGVSVTIYLILLLVVVFEVLNVLRKVIKVLKEGVTNGSVDASGGSIEIEACQRSYRAVNRCWYFVIAMTILSVSVGLVTFIGDMRHVYITNSLSVASTLCITDAVVILMTLYTKGGLNPSVSVVDDDRPIGTVSVRGTVQTTENQITEALNTALEFRRRVRQVHSAKVMEGIASMLEVSSEFDMQKLKEVPEESVLIGNP